MHLRISTVKRKGKAYHYAQLVQSYRRDDGMPAHRLIHSFGRVTKEQGETLKAVFRAANPNNKKKSRTVVAPDELIGLRKADGTYRYLDLALLLECWERWDLTSLLDQIVPDSSVEVPISTVVAALVLHRCVEPDSKLAAVTWFVHTALPELVGVKPAHFNNTRIHRALEALEIVERPLQRELARRVAHSAGPLRVLYLDCSDTWFVGRGPEIASRGKTKEGLYAQQIGIVLLCTGEGFPLRWATVEGRHDERKTMLDMVRDVAEEEWAQQVPVVMDRAMGSGATVRELASSGMRYITAVRVNEFASYTDRMPLGRFEVLCGDDADLDSDEHRAALGARAVELGMQHAGDEHYLLDLGNVSRAANGAGVISRCRAALLLAMRIDSELSRGRSADELAAEWEIGRAKLYRHRALLGLSSPLRERVLKGEADRLSEGALREVAELPDDEQHAALDAAIAKAGERTLWATQSLMKLVGAEPLQVRAVVTFRPDLYVRQRVAAQAALDTMLSAAEELNERLRSPQSRRDANSVLAEFGSTVRKLKLTNIVQFEVHATGKGKARSLRITTTIDEAAWRKRRATDGLNLVIAHRDQIGSAADLVDMYFGKDKVEKCFRTIKSALELRPVHHRTDHKVRAHVTLCVLGLLLERTLERDLRNAGLNLTAPAALTTLQWCSLQRYENPGVPLYTTVRAEPDQAKLLRALGHESLMDDKVIADRIQPR